MSYSPADTQTAQRLILAMTPELNSYNVVPSLDQILAAIPANEPVRDDLADYLAGNTWDWFFGGALSRESGWALGVREFMQDRRTNSK